MNGLPVSEEAEPHRARANAEALAGVCEWIDEAIKPKVKRRKLEAYGPSEIARRTNLCDAGGAYI